MNEIINITLRRETPADYSSVENLTREAFWNVHVPGCDEHYLAHVLRGSDFFIAELDFVAEYDGILVGNIMYANSHIASAEGVIYPVLTFGPVSVLPQHQSKGIGSALILHTLALARELGHKIVVIYGDPEYYQRFGFIAGEQFGIRSRDGFFAPALQVLELVPRALNEINGRFCEAEVYSTDAQAAEEFEASFPPKPKAVTASQKRFLELLSQCHE
ncbi:MAG: N-acetyltransferase [Candidatus Cloacimonas sp.]|jgi:predicted N-acetyltransferase YhbS|nr:N-acetyltransferase [Candidatus Cloacimonas sp.]